MLHINNIAPFARRRFGPHIFVGVEHSPVRTLAGICMNYIRPATA